MLNKKEELYYSRQLLLDELGKEGQERLCNAKVLVVGAGGLGCPVLQYIAGAGVGYIGIVDGDKVDISNLHRQILFQINEVGSLKANIAKEKIQALNPHIKVQAYPDFLKVDNIEEIFSNYDFIVDCTDNYETRYLINDACYKMNIPLIYGAIYRFQGQVSVFHYNNGPTYRCLFPNPPSESSVTNCSESGVIGVLPGIIGIMQANELIKCIIGKGEILSGKVLIYNAMNNNHQTLKLNRNKEEYLQSFLKDGELDKNRYGFNLCATQTIKEIEVSENINVRDFQWVDVREMEETPVIQIPEVIKAPLSDLENQLHKIRPGQKTIVFCKSGVRSRKAISIIQNKNENYDLYNLTNGWNNNILELWKQKA